MKNFNFYKTTFLILTLILLITLEVLAFYTKQYFIFYVLIALTIFIILNALPQISKRIESAFQKPFKLMMRHIRRMDTRKSQAVYNGVALIHFLCATILLLVMSWLIKSDDFYSSIIVAPFVAVFMEKGFNALAQSFKAISQEGMKKSSDDDYLRKYYKKNYDQTVELKNGLYSFLYEPKFINKQHTIHIDDDNEKMFEMGEISESNFDKLMSLHSSSNIPNSRTIRLDDLVVKEKDVYLTTSRSTFYNDLVSNRAMDYKVDNSYSLRDVYEFGPKLTPFKNSYLSNHIGINALVFLNDNTFLMPVRDESSTMSKNQATSSLAFKAEDVEHFTPEELKHNQIVEKLHKILYIDFNEDTDEINFLGCGRNVYDGGKPQFYFYVTIGSLNRDQYREHLIKAAENADKNAVILDKNKKIMLADLDSLSLGKHNSTYIDVYVKDKKTKEEVRKQKVVEFEKSFFANIYHYQHKDDKINATFTDYEKPKKAEDEEK